MSLMVPCHIAEIGTIQETYFLTVFGDHTFHLGFLPLTLQEGDVAEGWTAVRRTLQRHFLLYVHVL